MSSERSKSLVGRTVLGGLSQPPEVQQGKLAGMLPCVAFGDGPPLVVFPGLGLSNANPTGLQRLWEVRRGFFSPLARGGFTIYGVNRRPGLAAASTMADLAADHASSGQMGTSKRATKSEEVISLVTRRLIEVVAIMAVGEGVVALAAPRRYSLLWRFGPESYKRLMTRFAGRPALVRLFAAAELGVGLWLALRQFPNGE